MIAAVTRLFPVWALLFAAVAYWKPEPFTGLSGSIVPVLAGLFVNTFWNRRLAAVKSVFPSLSVLAIALIIAIVVALKRDQLAVLGAPLAAAVILHNLGGLALGYGLARRLGLDRRISRTLAIEVGMQNSGLAVALPGAVFSIGHNLSGSMLAGYWARAGHGKRR